MQWKNAKNAIYSTGNDMEGSPREWEVKFRLSCWASQDWVSPVSRSVQSSTLNFEIDYTAALIYNKIFWKIKNYTKIEVPKKFQNSEKWITLIVEGLMPFVKFLSHISTWPYYGLIWSKTGYMTGTTSMFQSGRYVIFHLIKKQKFFSSLQICLFYVVSIFSEKIEWLANNQRYFLDDKNSRTGSIWKPSSKFAAVRARNFSRISRICFFWNYFAIIRCSF